MSELLTEEILFYIAVGFAAQIVDGALGMAYGVTASSVLMMFGLPPATVSATVHAAECFSTGASAISHKVFGNIDQHLFMRLLPPAILGAVLGAYILTHISGDFIKPIIAAYLIVIGLVIIIKAFMEIPPRAITTYLGPLGFFGAFTDAIGGGGWGPIVATSLIARGNDVKKTIGSVNAVEFFVTFAASVTFFLTLGFSHLYIIAGLAIGGIVAAPLAAYIVKIAPTKIMMILVGILVVGLSTLNLIDSVF